MGLGGYVLLLLYRGYQRRSSDTLLLQAQVKFAPATAGRTMHSSEVAGIICILAANVVRGVFTAGILLPLRIRTGLFTSSLPCWRLRVWGDILVLDSERGNFKLLGLIYQLYLRKFELFGARLLRKRVVAA